MTTQSGLSPAYLHKISLFASLPENELEQLAATLRPLDRPANCILFREDDPGDRFFIILDGELDILKAADTPDERLVGMRVAGEYLGEMSLLNPDGLRTATVRTRTPVRLLEMTRADFDSLFQRHPWLAFSMVRMFSQRLREAQDEALADLIEKNQQLTLAYEELKAAHLELLQKEKLERELQVARDVQTSFMPRSTPQLPGWEFAAHWQPARQVSGDFYDFIPRPDGRLALVIADVTDKGMPAALFMALSRSTLRASLLGVPYVGNAIRQANRLISADSPDSMFVTMMCALLDPGTGEFTYVNAGHNPPLLYRAATDSFEWLARTGMPLGVDADADFRTGSLLLAPGDVLLTYTDGVPDAIDVNEAQFGSDRLLQLAQEHRHGSVLEIVGAFQTALAQFVGNTTPYDDITMLVVKRT